MTRCLKIPGSICQVEIFKGGVAVHNYSKLHEIRTIMEIIADSIESLKERRNDFEKAAELQMAVWNGKKPERQPLILHCQLDEEDNLKFPDFNTKEIHYDSQRMFASQFRIMMTAVYGEAEAVPSVRAHMGVGIFPSLFGVRQQLFEDKPPWVQEHISKERLAHMVPEDMRISDEFKAGLEHMAYMGERLAGTGCKVYPMDLQGPFDVAHMVYGDAIFYDIYDDPAFIHHLLDLSCHAIFMGIEECFRLIPGSDDMVPHYNGIVIPRHKGGIKTSEDTSTLLSGKHIEEFVVPYLDRVFSRFGGGYVHYCGKNPYLFEAVMNMPKALGLNLGNPDMHDMEYVLKRCAQAEKIYYGLITKMEDESLEDYFARYLKASKKGNRNLLLMDYNCKKEERQAVLESWESAGCSVDMGGSDGI